MSKKSIANRRSFLSLAAPIAVVLPVIGFIGCAAETEPGVPENVGAVVAPFEEFRATVYQEPESGVFIVNGDTPIDNERELEQFYEEFVREGALIVHKNGAGGDAKWNDTQKMNLTYCVSTAFGANHAATVSAMNASTAQWEAAANGKVNFIHLSGQDATCTAANTNVVFDVRPVAGQPFLARAFFPDSPRANRNILIDASSFGPITPWTLTGVLRHELGHTLGFRHEHTRPESGVCFEDSNWRALTPYDALSVMHYPQCNGTQTGDLVITPKDKEGINVLYNTGCNHSKCLAGPPLSASACGAAVASVCSVDPYCCTTAWDGACISEVYSVGNNLSCNAGACAHPLCEAGDKLTSGCDSTGHVAAICAADPYCCNTAWDSVCVSEVAAITGKTCDTVCAHDKCVVGGPLSASACGTAVATVCSADPYCCNTAWDSTCVAEVYSVAGSVSCGTGSCAHALCAAGASLTAGCDSNGTVSAICAADPYCCSTSWDSACVSEISSVAGKNCN